MTDEEKPECTEEDLFAININMISQILYGGEKGLKIRMWGNIICAGLLCCSLIGFSILFIKIITR